MKYLSQTISFGGGVLLTLIIFYFLWPRDEIFSNPKDPADAHALSVKYRIDNGYCDCTKQANFFEISEKAAKDFTNAVEKIETVLKNHTPSIANPATYRCVYGTEPGGNTVLMVVGLNAQKEEYIIPNSIQQLDGHLPCPILCDKNIALSKIVMGTSTAQDCCK